MRKLFKLVGILAGLAVLAVIGIASLMPWLVQMGAERGGMYSYAWFETNLLRCELINADSSLYSSGHRKSRRAGRDAHKR